MPAATQGWTASQLGEYLRIKHGYAFKGKFFARQGRYIVLTPGNFKPDGGLRLKGDKEKYYVGSFPDEYLLRRGDFLIVMTDLTQNAPILGSPAFVPESGKFLHNQRLGKIVDVDESGMDRRFLYYLFNSYSVRAQIKASATGATVRHTAPERVYAVEVDVPPLPTQHKIAAILSAYDELIENNLRRIQMLEEMAQLLYREWFVHFRFPGHEAVRMVDSPLGPIPEGWEAVHLGDVLSTLESGSRPRGGIDAEERDVPSIGAENVIGLGKYDFSKEKYVSREFFDNMKKGHVRSGDVALYKDGAKLGRKSLFRDGFPHVECCVNEHVFRLRSDGRCDQSYLYFWLDLPDVTQAIINLNTNAAQPGINQEKVRSLSFLLPDERSLDTFENVVEPVMANLFNLAKQNVLLRETRDALLPRLISGEIDVSQLDSDTGELEA